MRTLTRDLSRFPQVQSNFVSIDHFLSSEVPAGLITIDYNGLPLDILNDPRGASTTLVTFHAALSDSVVTYPVFQALGIMRDMAVNVVCVSDPSLAHNPALNLSWHAGNERQPVQRDLPAVLRHIIKSQGSDHVIFFGASGGGFASLYYGSFFDDSVVLATNPQTIIKNYLPEAVEAYGRLCWGAKDYATSVAALNENVTADVRHLYRGGFRNTVAYVQNLFDTKHLYRQLAPFLKATPRSERMNVLLGDWGSGHRALPAPIIAALLNGLAECDGQWATPLAEMGFVTAPEERYPIDVREEKAPLEPLRF